jgi:glycosyltransferase involved in cell wall biosynthesis
MPHTRILRTALREGIIREDAHLLPHDEKDLNKLFYCKRSSLFFDYIIIYAFKCVEQYLKPLVKAVLGRNRERTQTGDAPRHSGDRTAYIPALHYSGRSMPYHIISLQPNKIEDRAVSNSFRYLERQDAVRMEYIEFSFLKQAVKIMLHKEHSPLMRVYRNLVGVAKLLMSRGRIVILGAEPFSELTFFLARLKRLHTCIYFTSWPWDEERFSHRLLGTYREKAWRRFLDGTVSVSVNELPCKALARYGAKPYHIPHAVHAYLFCPGNARALSGKLNVLFVGHLQQHKGVHLLIDIIKQGAWDSAEFWFVGRGPYAEELKAMQQQGYPVKYFGFLRDRKKVAGIFQEADVLVLPSIKTGKHDEKFGMVLQEAMASSLAIIASDCVGPRQVIDNGKTGLLIPQNDRAALRDALHRLIDDPDLRAALGTNGRHKAEKVYDVKVVATKWLDIIRSLNHRPRGREVRDAAAGEKQRTRCASFTAVPACAAVKKTKERNLAMYYTRARSLIVFLVLLGAVLACSQSIKTDHNESVNRSLGHKTPFDEILHRKRTVRSLIEQKVGEGQDISRAQALDKKAGIAMKQGRMEECARLLLDAITLLEGGVVLERTEPDPTGQRKPVPVEISVGSPSVEVIAAVPDVDSGIKWSSPEAAFQAFQLPAENGKVTVQVGTAPVIIREIIEPGPAAAAPAAAGKKELPFGIHGIDQFDDRLLDLGIGWIRYAAKCSMVWDIIEPERGVFDWTLSDAALNEARRNGMHMLINVISFNRWDQGRGRGRGCRKLPKDLAAYKAFLEKAVRRYPFVDAWQIENEPDRRISWADTPENFAELLCTAYPVIKGANPDALVVAGGASRPLALSEEFWSRFFTRLQGLSTAGNRCFDVFDCHWFLHLHPTMETFGQFTEYIRDIQRRLAAAGYQDTPIWMTEIASYSGKPFLRKTRTTMPEISEKQQAAELVKLLVHGMNLGVSRMFWVRLIEWHNYGNAGPDSYFDNVGLINSPLTDGQSHKKLAYFTYKHLIATLRGADLRTIATLHLGENVHIYRVLKGAQPVYIVWAD